MTHLYIEQNTGLTEEVDNKVIEKLYDTVTNNTLDETSDLKGRLHSISGYNNEVTYLNNTFQDLYITCDKLYVKFQDPFVEQALISKNLGDGTGLTIENIRAVTSFKNAFFRNTNITSFNELELFTGITEINSQNSFSDCTNLTSINLKNITKVSGVNGYQRWNFEGCTSLTNIGDTSNITYLGYQAFQDCPITGNIDFSNVTVFGSQALNNTGDLSQCIIDQSKIEFIDGNAFKNKSEISYFSTINMPNLKTIQPNTTQESTLSYAFGGCSQIQHVIDLGQITKIGNAFDEGVFDSSNLLDAILPETVERIGFTVFKCRNLRYVKILSTNLPTYVLTDGHGNTRSYGEAFGESYRNKNPSNSYDGHTYPIYVRDDLYSQYQVADGWSVLYQVNRLKPLSQFATDFPNG